MKREVLTTVTFKENCEYQASTNTQKISVPKQTVEVSISFTNETKAQRNTLPQYNDKLKFIAHVYQSYTDGGQQHRTNITVGRIEFYYLPDGAKTPIQLNQTKMSDGSNSCMLNSEGLASIIYRPNKKGQFFAKYIDDNDFYETNISPYITVDMQPIQVSITIDAPPILASIHDEVELTAHVTNADNNQPLPYGVVTFLHYQSNNDVDNGTNERVIGNPVMVEEDGTAKIKYIPVQTDDNTEPYVIDPPYKEHIRAVYNYSNVLYGEQWKYYKEASARTQIAIRSRDSITIGLDNNNINNVGQRVYEAGETINLYGVITDKDNNTFPIKTSGNYKANLTFHIEGTHTHPTKNPSNIVNENDFNYIKYSKDISASYVASDNKYYFTKAINNLLPGIYTITASCTEQEGTNDKMYDSIDSSNILYIQVNYTKNIPRTVLSTEKTTVHINETLNNLKSEVLNLSNNQMNILNGKPCIFEVYQNHKTYSGTLTYSGGKLIGTPNTPIQFNQTGPYHIYMSVPNGVYTNAPTNTTYHNNNMDMDFYIEQNDNASLLIQVTNEAVVTLKVDVQQKDAPGIVNYTIKGQYITKPIRAHIYLVPTGNGNISMINTVQLTPEVYEIHDSILQLDAGTYRIEVELENDDVISKTFSIGANNLSMIINDSSKSILGTPNNTVSASLYSKSNLNSIDTSKIKAYIQSANTNFDITKAKQVSIQSATIAKDGSVKVVARTGLYKEGEWWLMLSYDGSPGFEQTYCTPQKFTTFLYTPNVQLIPNQDRYDIQVYYDNDRHYMNNNALLIRFICANGNNGVAQGVIVTDEQGFGSFNDDKYPNLSWWNGWNRLILFFEPYDTENISLMKTQPAYNALDSKYNYVFDASNITNMAQPTYNFATQIIANEEQALYTGYKPIEMTVTRPLK